jgi:hypothetical protein
VFAIKNERIKYFLKECNAQKWGVCLAPDRSFEGVSFRDEELQEFVDMIVEECILVLGLSDTYEKALIKHFGEPS